MDLLLNETAQAVLERARHEARRNGAATVRSEHLMLALLGQEGLVEDLIRYGIPIERARVQIEALVASEERNAEHPDPPLSEEVEGVLEQASRDAWADAHNRVGPRHLLAALVNRPWDRVAWLLAQCDVDVGYLRDRLRPPRRGRSEPLPPETDPADHFLAGWLDEGVHAVLGRARQEAESHGYQRVQPQHLLIGLLGPQDGLASQVCRAIELDPSDVVDEAARWIASDAEGPFVGGVRLSRSVVDVLRFALEAAVKLGAEKADCGDVFSALLVSGEPFFPTLLERFHVAPCELRHELLDLRGPDSNAVLEEAATMSTDARRLSKHDVELDRALTTAREEAEKNASDHVGTEHLLLALALDTRSVAARALQACGIDLMRARELIEPATWGRSAPQGELPWTPRADRAMHVARLEGRHLDQRVGTGHLLLALYWQLKGTASRLLQDLGVVPSRLRKEVLAVTTSDEGAECCVFPPLTTRARVVLRQAARLVTGPEWPAVNRGHILQALLPQKGGTAREVIEKLVLSRGLLVARAEAWAKASEGAERPRAFTPSVWEALDAAWEEAERQGLGHVGTGHLLYGVLAATQGRIRTVFASADPSASSIRAVLDSLVGTALCRAWPSR